MHILPKKHHLLLSHSPTHSCPSSSLPARILQAFNWRVQFADCDDSKGLASDRKNAKNYLDSWKHPFQDGSSILAQ